MVKKIKLAAEASGLEYQEVELTRLTGMIMGRRAARLADTYEVPDGASHECSGSSLRTN